MPKKPGQSCKTCTHWDPTGTGVGGFCRRENPRWPTRDMEQIVAFPVTLSHEWCDNWTKITGNP